MQSEKELKLIISNENLNYADFEFKEADLTKENEISYKRSTISKKYQTGQGTSWPADFEFDLKTNFFGTR